MAQLLAGAAALAVVMILAGASAEMCGLKPTPSCGSDAPAVHDEHDYSAVIAPRRDLGIDFPDLPGFTRSTYHRDHALITPESRVWAGNPAWNKSLTAHLISPASGANFAMYLANLKEGGAAASPDARVERFVFVLEGEVVVSVHEADGPDGDVALAANHYVYFPAGSASRLTSPNGAAVLVYERVYAAATGAARLVHGFTEASPLLPVSGEVFRLRKLLPQTAEYDFNVHVMDFAPGEYLNVKEIHYNQHGLLLVEGQGIYRLADNWYPVQAGDAIWMAPYVIQWYAALGSQPSRYILYKDTTVDPLFS